MKEKTSITLSTSVLSKIDRMAGSKQSRSAFIEEVLTRYMRDLARQERDSRDLAIINRNVAHLNDEALDGLEFQAPLAESPEE